MGDKGTRVLFLIKLIHTVIWVILSSAVFYVVWSGFSGKLTPFLDSGVCYCNRRNGANGIPQ